MNADYEKQLEDRVGRELKALGELEAPPEIARRVMRVIEQRAAMPWYRHEWPAWPLAIRGVSLAGLLTAFAGVCLASLRLVHFAVVSPAGREVSGWFSLADSVWNAATVLVNALGLALRSLGPAVLIGTAALLLVCYAMCVGLGTVYWRLAYVRR